MKPNQLWKERVRFFLLGMAVVMGFVLLTGGVDSPPPPNYGRYQISAWSTQFSAGSGGVGAFVVDTATGETRTAYSRIYGNPGPGEVVKNNLGKKFFSMD